MRKKERVAKGRKSKEPSTKNDPGRRTATGRRTSKPEVRPEVDNHSNKNGGRRRSLNTVNLDDVIVDGRKRVTKQRKGATKGVRKDGGSRKKAVVEEPFQGRAQPINDEDSKTIIDSGELYMETEQSMKVADATVGLMEGMIDKTEKTEETEKAKDIAKCKGGAPSGRKKEENGVLKLRGKVKSRRPRVATRVKEREENERLTEVQSSRADRVKSETWKASEWEESIRKELNGKKEELTEGGERRSSNEYGSKSDGKTKKAISDRNEDTTMEEAKEATEGKDEELNEKRNRRFIRGKQSKDRTENSVTKNQKFRQKLTTKRGRRETILVIPNYQRETTTLLDDSSIQNSTANDEEPPEAEDSHQPAIGRDAEDSFKPATARDALKKTAPHKNDTACDNKSVEIKVYDTNISLIL